MSYNLAWFHGIDMLEAKYLIAGVQPQGYNISQIHMCVYVHTNIYIQTYSRYTGIYMKQTRTYIYIYVKQNKLWVCLSPLT